jgi:hypothetical protein
LIVLGLFFLLVALTGGSSRADPQSLLLLRPATVLFCAYGLACASAQDLRDVRAPLAVVLAVMALALLQLVPLPAAVWRNLPNRELVAAASSSVGLGTIARPLSLTPAMTWNTFFSLFVPLTGIVLVAVQAPENRNRVIPFLMAVALLSALFGFLQALGSNGLQLYRITHKGVPTGLFANRNHQSIMLLWLMLAACWMGSGPLAPKRSAKVGLGGAIATVVALFPLLILTGSRAGLLLSVATLFMCGWLLLRAPATRELLKRGGRRTKILVGGGIGLISVPLLVILVVLALSDRETALSRLFQRDALDDLRWLYLPYIKQMAADYFPWGSGFGSFADAFNGYEPASMLSSHYMNAAHDDPLQLVVEGGLPIIAIVAVALGWVAARLARLWRSDAGAGRALAIFIGGSYFLWLSASFVDYPLRTPIGAMLFAVLTAQLSLSSVRGSISGVPDRAATGA